MSELIRQLLSEAEEMAERHADDKGECLKWGSRDGALANANHERATRSLIRKARRVVLELERGQ